MTQNINGFRYSDYCTAFLKKTKELFQIVIHDESSNENLMTIDVDGLDEARRYLTGWYKNAPSDIVCVVLDCNVC